MLTLLATFGIGCVLGHSFRAPAQLGVTVLTILLHGLTAGLASGSAVPALAVAALALLGCNAGLIAAFVAAMRHQPPRAAAGT